MTFPCFTLPLRDSSLIEDCQLAGGLYGQNRMPNNLRDCPSGRYPSRDSCTPLRFAGSFFSPCNSKSTPPCRHPRLSSTTSHVPTAPLEHPGLISSPSPPPGQMCVNRRKRRVLCLAGFSAFPLPGPQGFLLRSVARLHRPCLFSTIRGSATLCPLPASGSPYRIGFLTSSQPRKSGQEGFPG